MTAFVVPFETHQRDSRVWVAWWSKDALPSLALQLRTLERDLLREFPLDGAWSSIGLAGPATDAAVCLYQVVPIDGLAPASTYQLRLIRPSGRIDATGLVETLPERLPDPGGGDLSQRPFTIMLGSCYYAPEDPDSKVDDAYVRLWNSPEHRPHLKILCGDQVYLDQPAGPWVGHPMQVRMSSADLRRWIIAKYRQAWRSLDDTLSRGANYMTSDDHEFWNDYPERPLYWGWPALYESVQYRRDWGNEGAAHFREIQQGANVTQLDIGDELSIFIADTRVNRQRDGVRFMAAEDFATMVEWVRRLRTPGVLVLGQPLLAGPRNEKNIGVDVLTSDHNLPYFVQYDDLTSALSWWCFHDLVVLAGDVHHGRIARFQIPRSPDIYPASIHEVVSSGMTVLPSAKSYFEIGRTGRGYPPTFPPYRGRRFNDLGTEVTYEQAVPRMPRDESGTENHFMTLQFTRHPRGHGIEVTVRAWLVDRDPERDLPASPWTYKFSLDVDRPASGFAMIAPPVLDLGEVGKDTPVTREHSLTISSVGPVPVVIREVRLQGTQAAQFALTPHPPRALPVTLQPGDAFPVSLGFRSGGIGEHQARVEVLGADLVGAPVVVEAILRANVVAPDIAVLPATVTFGRVQPGQQVERNFIVTSYGSAPLRFRVEPPAPQTPYQWTGDAPNQWRTLQPGEDAVIAVRYLPISAGPHQATVVVLSNDETAMVQLVGEAVPPPPAAIRAAPRELNFGVITVGTTATQRLSLANDGPGPLIISATRIDGPDRKLFALVGPTPSVIKARQTATLDVTFTPAGATGGHQATLVIESNAANARQLGLNLLGRGASATLQVDPIQIAFNPSPLAATLPVGAGSQRVLHIYNVGTSALTLAGASFRVLEAASAQVSPHFRILDASGQPFPEADVRLDAGAFQSLSLQFRPVVAGDHSGRVRVTPTSQALPPVTVTVSGRGVA